MPFETNQLLELIDELRRLDQDRRVFGACRGHKYILNPRLTERQVLKFETDHRLQLPIDYRDFLLEIGDGGTGPYYGLLSLENAAYEHDLITDFPFSHETHLETVSDWEAWEDYPGTLQISEHGCGNRTRLIVRGTNYSEVWYDFWWDLFPVSPAFSEWYGSWAERCIGKIRREPLIDKIQVGMSLDEVTDLLGPQTDKWTAAERLGREVTSDEYNLAFEHINASFTLGPDHRIRRINRMYSIC